MELRRDARLTYTPRLRLVAGMLGRALRLLHAHVRCTCTMPGGAHAATCHRVLTLQLTADAEEVGVGLDHNAAARDGQRAAFARAALRAMAVLIFVLVLGCGSPDVARVSGTIVVVVDPAAPASLYVQAPFESDGTWEAPVGEPFQLVSWPARLDGTPPSEGRVPGTVEWSVEGDPGAAEFWPVNDTLTLARFLRPSPRGEPFRLRAELRPAKRRITL